ncbi:glyoxalase/Bleomycin resistance protein/Dihydroxybiphenyl dioxygenase [Artemisia annua]|uniref:Glyoxalase/Bleomycin resistance protein/Dihydroxybiphenyl dioxygenase n=1 Tax=Artemisia annua TaxID=35608 RepID=A0A2U1PEG8_ARTAN|nr:glyoxalase/Bleomycin resistance protein/Dihydroxybiphenyl dioxygenase [Artemisia annua]
MATEVTNGAETNGESVEKTVTFTAVKSQVFVEATKVNDAVLFYKSAFGAEEVNRVSQPKRKADQEMPLLQSAEIKLGSASIILADASDDDTVKTVGSGVVFCLETEDIEAAVDRAVKAGAVADGEITEGEGAWFGGRVGKVKDPYGIVWVITTPTAKKSANVEA